MSDFDLDLGSIEREMDEAVDGRVVLGVLDGETPSEEWAREVEEGNVLVLNVVGDMNELASGFARDVKEGGGSLIHFRDFLIVTPPGIEVDTERLN